MNSVTINCENKDVVEIIEWCDNHVGLKRWDWVSQFPSYRYTFTFDTAEQATHFRLRWQ